MAIKAIVTHVSQIGPTDIAVNIVASFIDTSLNQAIDLASLNPLFGTDLVNYTPTEFIASMQSQILAYAATKSYSMTASDILWSIPNAFTATEITSLKSSITARSFSAASRTLNSAFQISTTRDSIVSYAVDIASTISLTSGQNGTVVLEYADNSGISTNVVTVNSCANGNTGSLTIGLNLTQTATATLSGMIPAGKFARIRTVNTTGTPTFTYRTGQEVLV